MGNNWEFLELHSEGEREEFAADALAVSIQMAIQKAMVRSGVSQKELAERLGVSPARVSQMLSANGRNLTVRTMGRIAHALGEDFEFIAVRELREIKAKSKSREKPRFAVSTGEFWQSQESRWTDVSANDDKCPWKQAA